MLLDAVGYIAVGLFFGVAIALALCVVIAFIAAMVYGLHN